MRQTSDAPPSLAMAEGSPGAASAGRRCIFFGTPAPGGDLVDAVALSDGRILAFTTDGAGFHDAANRRWVRVTDKGIPPGEWDIALVDGYLLRGDGARLQLIAEQGLPSFASCDANMKPLPWKDEGNVQSTMIDRSGRRVAILGSDGSARYWTGRGAVPILSAVTAGPNFAKVVQVIQTNQGFDFIAMDGLWSYDLAKRIGTRRSYSGLPKDVLEIDLALPAADPNGNSVPSVGNITAWGAGGAVKTKLAGSATGSLLTPVSRQAICVGDRPRGRLLSMCRGA